MTFKPWLDQDVPWLCYKSTKNNLVYFTCNKCASTFYDALFEKLEWKKITTIDVDWNKDFIFSYIRHPLVRHRKGIVEGVVNFFPYMKKVFLDDYQALKFLANVTSVEAHSFSIYRMLGDNALKIQWIPIDTDLDHKKETLRMLKLNNETIPVEIENWFAEQKKQNESTEEELKLYNQLSCMPVPPEIVRYLDFDMCLYDKVTTPPPHILAKEYYQRRIKDLLDQGMNQIQAEEIVDQEVYNNKHTFQKTDHA